MSERDDIESVRRSEEIRNPHYDEEKAKKRTQELREFKNVYISILEEMKFSDAICALELQHGTAEYDEFVQIWTEYRQGFLEKKKTNRKRQT